MASQREVVVASPSLRLGEGRWTGRDTKEVELQDKEILEKQWLPRRSEGLDRSPTMLTLICSDFTCLYKIQNICSSHILAQRVPPGLTDIVYSFQNLSPQNSLEPGFHHFHVPKLPEGAIFGHLQNISFFLTHFRWQMTSNYLIFQFCSFPPLYPILLINLQRIPFLSHHCLPSIACNHFICLVPCVIQRDGGCFPPCCSHYPFVISSSVCNEPSPSSY